MGEPEEAEVSLSSLYSDINKGYSHLETTDESSGSESYQSALEKSINLCKQAISHVKQLSLFSDNEELDELSSESIKFLLLPAFLGYFLGRKQKGDRKEILDSSKAFFENYLKLCADYGIYKVTEASKSADPGKQRAEKVRRLKEQRALEGRLTELQAYVERDHVDEEVKREFYITQVKKWITISEEELSSIERELPILDLMARGGPPVSQPRSAQPSFQPFILTRSKAQAGVFGAGYPSLPTYSVEEFYEMQAKEGRLPAPGQLPSANTNHNEPTSSDEEREEKKEEEDDPEHLKKKRDWDDFKDENRRGDGNRKNRG